jgi:hypothetical protein
MVVHYTISDLFIKSMKKENKRGEKEDGDNNPWPTHYCSLQGLSDEWTLPGKLQSVVH